MHNQFLLTTLKFFFLRRTMFCSLKNSEVSSLCLAGGLVIMTYPPSAIQIYLDSSAQLLHILCVSLSTFMLNYFFNLRFMLSFSKGIHIEKSWNFCLQALEMRAQVLMLWNDCLHMLKLSMAKEDIFHAFRVYQKLQNYGSFTFHKIWKLFRSEEIMFW